MKIIERSFFIFLWLLILSASAVRAEGPASPAPFNGATPLRWSVRMADSEMARRGDSLAWKTGGKAKWDYTTGLFTLALLKLNESVPDTRYVAFATNAIGLSFRRGRKNPRIQGRRYQLDALNSGRTVLALFGNSPGINATKIVPGCSAGS